MISYRKQGGTSGVLTESGNAMQVKSGDGQVLMFHKAESLKREVSFLGYPIRIDPCLGITSTPINNNRCGAHKRIVSS